MLDIKFIRQNPEVVKKAAVDKGINVDIGKLLAIDIKRRKLIESSESLRAEQNKKSKGPQSSENLEELRRLKERIKNEQDELKSVGEEFNRLMAAIPNIISPDTPRGSGERSNAEVYSSKIPKFNFAPKDYIELAESLDLVDFERGAKVSGYRGYYLKNESARMAMALMMFAADKMAKKGYLPMIPPTIVKDFVLFGSGYFEGTEYNHETDEIYEIASANKDASGRENKEKKFLVGTAEPSLLGYYSGEVLKEEDLPIRLFGFSQCYRSEIGSYGKDTKGLYRVHEFMKVEQVVISKADIPASDKLQQEMVNITKEIHDELGLPYRVLRICAGDLGSGKYKQYDYEAWLPGLGRWAETGSASNFLDWQARRLNIKYIDKNGEKKFVYLLNNTALPTPRPLIAIFENYQTAKGTIKVPKVLQKYMGGVREIKKKA